jgi:iron complex transport system ATP-binding protein
MKLLARSVGYRYSKSAAPVLSDVTFEAECGAYWCLAGPNGSGKSTFLKLACGLLPTDKMEGELSWDGVPLSAWPRLELAKRVALVPGNLKTSFPVSVEEFVLQARFAHSPAWKLPSARDREVADAAIEKVGITALRASLITELSAGETQLATIARALTQEPKVLILDEATSNLDLGFQARIFALLASLNKQNLSIFVVSHDLNLAAEFCPKALWLNKGKVQSSGSMKETLTPQLVDSLYGAAESIAVGENPFTHRPKIFWR